VSVIRVGYPCRLSVSVILVGFTGLHAASSLLVTTQHHYSAYLLQVGAPIYPVNRCGLRQSKYIADMKHIIAMA
ncbi:MAG: hypothetical protein SGI99_13555, partial [Pseudomonadota bacterium]|nr:hypothetical protein [Pseudomonadota bacterium]